MTDLIIFLETMPFWYWFILAAICLILEISTGTTYFLWPAGAGLLVGLVAIFLPEAWVLQLFIFAIVTILLIFYATPVARTWLYEKKTDHELLNQRGAQKIGKTVTADNDFENGRGKVKYGDTLWQAEVIAGTEVSEGATLKVTAVRGTVLVVEPV